MCVSWGNSLKRPLIPCAIMGEASVENSTFSVRLHGQFMRWCLPVLPSEKFRGPMAFWANGKIPWADFWDFEPTEKFCGQTFEILSQRKNSAGWFLRFWANGKIPRADGIWGLWKKLFHHSHKGNRFVNSFSLNFNIIMLELFYIYRFWIWVRMVYA